MQLPPMSSTSVPTTPSAPEDASGSSPEEQLSVFFNVAGLYQKIVVQDGWFVGDLIKFMAKISAELHPHADVPECNAIRNNQTRKFVALADPATRALVHGNLYDLLYVEKAAASSTTSALPLALHDEIQVVFYSNPLGITIKPVGDGTYVVATKKKELNCYRRLTPGMQVVSIGPASLTGMDFREFHTTMVNSEFPLTAVFRATTESIEIGNNNNVVSSASSTAAGDDGQAKQPHPEATSSSAPESPQEKDPSSVDKVPTTKDTTQPPPSNVDTFNVPVPVVFQDDGSVQGRVRRYRPSVVVDSPRNDVSSPSQHPLHASTPADQQVPSSVPLMATLQDEVRLEEGLKSLNEAFYKKKRELNDIVDRIREYTQQLSAVRAALSAATPLPPHPPSSSSMASGGGLTFDMLQQAQAAGGPPPRGGTSLNLAPRHQRKPSSVVSGVSSCTSSILHHATSQHHRPPPPQSSRVYLPPKSRQGVSKGHHMSSSASVCSLTSTCSIDRMAFKKNRLGKYGDTPAVSSTGTLSGRTKKPSTLSTTAFSSTLQLPSSFSTKGAVIPQAQTPRGSAFLNPKSTTPGVGHYDVKDLSKNVRGGEIGDSDRDLTWS
ncbi:hypothetical protein DYB25_002953 [Aphanomyces astaci]|uniref:PDZ domain-containing protein n=1 Tax=Aphanomyces astaci TaxID=112090 RepID=A0A397B8Q5_APHAT|nr:hypothetical protein DYB25_002953 [Aphanomyces astaci]